MIIRQVPLPTSKYASKCPYSMTPEFLVIHNTANDASAANEISYMQGASSVSFHYAVDDKEAIQGLPLDRNGWHAGDGANGRGNRKGIGIEICYSKSGGARFDQAEKNGALLAAKLLHARGWGLDKVKKHQDFSGKYCPHRTLDRGWQRFLNMVQAELNALNAPPFVWVKMDNPREMIAKCEAIIFDIPSLRVIGSIAMGAVTPFQEKTVFGGRTYLRSRWSVEHGKNNGVLIDDLDEKPVAKPEPPVEPEVPIEPELPEEPKPEPEPVPEVPDYAKENNTMLKWLVELVKSLLDWIRGVR